MESKPVIPPLGHGPFEYSASEGWKSIEDPMPDYDGDAPPGYLKVHWLGESEWIRFFESLEDGTSTHMYCVQVTPFCSLSISVYLASVVDLLSLLTVLQPLMTLEIVEQGLEQLKIGRKTFHAQHGHDVSSVCRSCDPVEWQRREDRRREAEKSRKGDAA